MADLKTTNIYGDAYINNKVGINTNTPATRLQIGQLSPTAATEGIQFGDDTGARIYRDSATIIKVAGGFTSTSYILAGNYLQTAGNLIYPSSQTATQRLEVGNASGNAWVTGIAIAQGGNVTVYNNLTVNNAATVTNDLTVNGNTYLGNANNDTVFVNDTIRIGATDSGDASLFFGEGGVAGSDYGARWYWDSGYTFTWYTRNAGTDTALFDYVTNDATYLNWRRNFHMQNKEINYNAQIHFNAGTRFVGSSTQYLIFRSDATNAGGIIVQDGTVTIKGYTGYWDSNGGGILNNTGNWAVRYNFGSENSGGTLYGAWTVNGNISATNLSGTNTGDQTVGNGTITIAAGTGISVASNTFTTNQTGNSTVTVTNSGVTSLTGTANRVTVSAATGAVTLNLPQDIHTGASPTFAAVSATTFTGALSGNATTATSADNIDGRPFVNTNSNSATNADSINSNGISYYTGGVTNFSGNATDGGLYSQAYSNDWQHQIAGDYRSGQIALRGKNSGTWQSWRRVLDDTNSPYALNMNQYVRTTDSPTFGTLQLTRLNFGATGAAPYSSAAGEGYGNGITFGGDENSAAYRIFTGMENIGGNYSKLTFNWHTGIRIGAYFGYGGIRFYDNYVGAGNKVFSIAESDSNVRVYNELIVQGSGINGAYGFMKYGGTRSGDWQLFTTSSAGAGQMNVVQVENIGGGGHTNYPTGVYTYGGVMSWRLPNHSFQLYAAHTGDLAYKTQWNNDNYSGWRRILDSTNYPYAANMNQYVRTTDTCSFAGLTVSNTINGSVSGNAATATTLATGRAINGVSFNGSAAITVNGLNYNVNNDWLRENGDDDQFKLYGNSRTMIYRTDGNTNAHGGGGYAHIFYYGGSADANRMFIINTDGRLWSPYHGWLDTMSISGNAATVTNGIYTTNYWTGTPLGKRRYRIHSSDGTSLNSSITNLECGFTYGGSGEPTGPFIAFGGLGGSIDYSCQLVGAYSGGGNDFKIRTRNDDTAAWNTWRTIVTDGNYTSYSPTLTGTGASGNWSINVTGNAATATTLQTARNINGTSFNGSAAITTATWGTARTITIGSTGKSVDGSANVSWTLAEIGAAATNQTMFIGTTSVAINRASAAISLAGTSIDGTAGGLNSSNYISRIGSSGNYNTDFQNTPAGTVRHQGDDANITNTPGGTWWFVDNYRHSNASNYWGTQVAWGWEDNANKLATRNITGNSFGSWVYYLNSVNYTDYTVTKTGTGASGTWGINITGNAATATTATNVTIANGSVTLAKIENITAYTILGNSNASAAATPAALSVATVATMLSGQTMNINGSSTSCSGTAANATTAGGLEVHTGTNNEANKIVRTQGNGYIMAGWINTISGDNGTTAIDRVYASSDGYIRYYTPANFRTVLDVPTRAGSGASGNWAINITGNAATATSATSATTATNVAASGITGQTGMWTSAARPGPYRLYRNDHDSAYNLQLTWQAHRTNYWSLRGFLNDTFHAECFVVYSGYADEAGALTIGNTYRVANLGINVAASNRLHINGDGTNPPIRIDNGALVTGVASNSKNTFQGYLPVSFGGTTYYIRLWT